MRARLFLVVAWVLCACGSSAHEPASAEPVEPIEQHEVAAPDPPPQRAAAPVAPTAPVAPAAPPSESAEWEKVKLADEAPLCVFSDQEQRDAARFIQDARKQTLRANSTLVFGTFPPGCMNEACDAEPTLQCWVESAEPNTLVVHSRLSFKHKPGTVCTKDCRHVVAGCPTDALKPGKYTVKYGARVFSLRVPSVMRDPCFKMK